MILDFFLFLNFRTVQKIRVNHHILVDSLEEQKKSFSSDKRCGDGYIVRSVSDSSG